MSWVAVGVGAVTAGLQYKQAKDQQKQQRINNELQAEIEGTSWATGRHGGPFQNDAKNPYTALMEGGMQGAMTGMAINQNMANAKTGLQGREAQKLSFNQQDVGNNPWSQMSFQQDPINNPVPSWKLKTGY